MQLVQAPQPGFATDITRHLSCWRPVGLSVLHLSDISIRYVMICYKFFGNLGSWMNHRHTPLNGGQSTNRAGVTGLSGNCRPNGDLTPIQLDSNSAHVIPAKTGIQKHRRPWMPVFTGMTRRLFHTNPTITEPSHAAH